MVDNDKPLLGNLVESDEPWSLEATQLRIEKLLNKKIKSGSIDSKNLAIVAKNISKIAGDTKTTKSIETELKKVHREGVKESAIAQKIFDHQKQRGKKDAAYQKDMTSQAAREILQGGSGGIVGGIKSLDKGIGRVISNFDSLDASVSGLGKFLTVIPLVGGTIGALVGWMGNQIDSYRQLISVGQSFNGNMLSMNYAARDAAMNMEEFGKFITKYSKLSAKVGAQGLASITKDVRATTRQFAHFGLSIEQANDFIANYTEQQVMQGRFDKMDDDTRRIKTANYMRQLTELSKLTGKSVEDLDKERKAMAENVDKFAIMAEMSKEEAARFSENFDVFEAGLSILPEQMQGPLQQTALQFQRWGTIANTELGQLMANLGGPVTDSFENLMHTMNAGNPEQTNEAMADFVLNLANTGKSTEEMAKITAFMFEGNVEEARKFAKSIQELQKANLGNKEAVMGAMEAIKKESRLKKVAQDKFEEDTRGMLKIQESLKALYGEIVKALVEALGPAIFKAGGAIGDFAATIIDWIQDGGVERAITWLTDLFAELTTEGSDLRNTIDSVVGIFKFLGENIGLVVAGFAAIIGLQLFSMFRGLGKVIKGVMGLAKGGAVAMGLAKGAGAASKVGGKLAKEAGEEVVEGVVKKGAAKIAGKGILKSLLKKIPGIGLIAGLGFAASRLMDGDFVGAGMEVASGAASIVPGLGTAASVGIDAALIARDLSAEGETAEPINGAKPKTTTTFGNDAMTDAGAATIQQGETATELTGYELLAQIKDAIERQHSVLEGIAGATGATALSSKKTADALGGFNANNLQ